MVRLEGNRRNPRLVAWDGDRYQRICEILPCLPSQSTIGRERTGGTLPPGSEGTALRGMGNRHCRGTAEDTTRQPIHHLCRRLRYELACDNGGVVSTS